MDERIDLRALREQLLEGVHGGELWAIGPDGHVRPVPCTYEGIKDGLGGATLTFVVCPREIGFYVDDEGMLNGSLFNFVASMLGERALYGPAVLTAAMPDDEGNTLPPPMNAVMAMFSLAAMWIPVVVDAKNSGQSLDLTANPDTIPPSKIIGFATEAEFLHFLETGEGGKEVE